MSKAVVCLTILLTLIMSCRSSNHVVTDLSDYTIEEFEMELDVHENIFVKFYLPTCIHCRNMAGEYIKTAKELREERDNREQSPIILAEVDCSSDAGESICRFYKIDSYPTLKFFK